MIEERSLDRDSVSRMRFSSSGGLGGIFPYDGAFRDRPWYPIESTRGKSEPQPQPRHSSREHATNVRRGIVKGTMEDDACTKRYTSVARLTGGIFTYSCEHGICIAWHVIPHCEGRNIPFSFFLRFLPRAPKFVIYDYACQLREYCTYCCCRSPSTFEPDRDTPPSPHNRHEPGVGVFQAHAILHRPLAPPVFFIRFTLFCGAHHG